MAMMGDSCAFTQRVGIERFEVALVGIAQGLGGGGNRGKSDDREEGRCKQGLTYRHLFTLSTVARHLALQDLIHVARVYRPRKRDLPITAPVCAALPQYM